MAISPELEQAIEQDMKKLKSKDIRRPGSSINKFMNDLSVIKAQAEKDKPSLVNAGYNESSLIRTDALLILLSLTHGERRGTTPVSAEKRAFFDQQMPLANLDKKRLSIVCSHIAESCGNKKVLRNYRVILQGSSMIDTLNDNLAMVSLVRDYPGLASQVKPGGVAIDETYCNEVKTRAMELLSICGAVSNENNSTDTLIDRQNRLITLCINSINEIKKYAHAAFFEDPEYYNRHYVLNSYSKNDDEETTKEEKEPVSAS